MRTKITIAADTLTVIAGRLRDRTTTLTAESRALGFSHNGNLRARLREHLGRERYADLMKGSRGGDTTQP